MAEEAKLPKIVVTGSERKGPLEQQRSVRTGSATSQEHNRLRGQGFEPNTAAYDLELAAQRRRESLGLPPIPEAYRQVGGGKSESNLAGLKALQTVGQFAPEAAKLASELARLLSLSRNKVF